MHISTHACMHAFKENYRNTYAIIDASEIFLEIPTVVIYGFSLSLGVTTSTTILRSCSLHAHLMMRFLTSYHFVLALYLYYLMWN